jgi:hypothetical protein
MQNISKIKNIIAERLAEFKIGILKEKVKLILTLNTIDEILEYLLNKKTKV